MASPESDARVAISQRSDPDTSSGHEEVHKGVKGDRYKMPQRVFETDDNDDRLRYAVIQQHSRFHVTMWFDGDERPTIYKDRLESWSNYWLRPEDYLSEDEAVFQRVEVQAGLRKPPGVPRPRRATSASRGKRAVDSDSSSSDSSSGEESGSSGSEEGEGDGGERVVDTWESDREDDEDSDAPGDDEGSEGLHPRLDEALNSMRWIDCGPVRTDPRVACGGCPENIIPEFRLPNFAQETLLNYFFSTSLYLLSLRS